MWAVFGLRCRGSVFFFGESEFFPEASDLLDHDEDHEGDDEEVRDGLEEIAVGDGRPADRHGQARDVDAIEEYADERRDDVGDERCHDLAEGGSHDDTDGEVDDIAAEREFFEILEHRDEFSIYEFSIFKQ
jgi:hypothetical protein